MSEILDTGNRREFSTGAVRDIDDTKGRMDLVPLDIIEELVSYYETIWKDKKVKPYYDSCRCVVNDIYWFTYNNDKNVLYELLCGFADYKYGNIYTAILELSLHFKLGAIKYAPNNWRKGIPTHSFLDSSLRHIVKFFRGDTDEDHARAFVWNIICLLWTKKYKPELDDIYYGEYTAEKIDEHNEKWNKKKPREEEKKDGILLQRILD